MPLAKHWIWEAFMTLGRERRMNEAEAVALLQDTFPSAAHLVLPAVAALGDKTQMKALLQSKGASMGGDDDDANDGELSGDMNARIRLSINRSLNTSKQSRNERGEFVPHARNESEPATMADAMRGFVNKHRRTVEAGNGTGA